METSPRLLGTSPAAVDSGVLERLREQVGDAEGTMLNELVTEYLSEGATHLTRLLAAVAAGDTGTVRSIGHTWSSTSDLLGATVLATMLRGLKQLVASPVELGAAAAAIEVEYGRVTEWLTGSGYQVSA
jgi:HPt (histidine-containing phosphotransfer) domain-containing protein